MKKRIAIFLVLVLSVSLASAFWPFDWIFGKKITGNVVDGTPVENSGKCMDSDGGVFSENKGEVSYSARGYFGIGKMKSYLVQDGCVANNGVSGSGDSGNQLREYYCSNGKVRQEIIKCLNGCENGRCRQRVFPTCIDTENMNLDYMKISQRIVLINSSIFVYFDTINTDSANYYIILKEGIKTFLFNWTEVHYKGKKIVYLSKITIPKTGHYNITLCKGELPDICCSKDSRSLYAVEYNSISEILPLYPKHNEIEANRINIVFVGSGFSLIYDIQKIAKQLMSFDGNFTEIVLYRKGDKSFNPPYIYRDAGFFAIEPMKSNRDKFNIWYLNFDLGSGNEANLSFLGLENMYIVYLNNLIENDENTESTDRGVSENPSIRRLRHDKINSSFISTKILGRSYNSIDLEKDVDVQVISGADYSPGDPLVLRRGVFLHESGHALFWLADQGTGPGNRYPNLADSFELANEFWGDLIGSVDPFYYEYNSFLNKPLTIEGIKEFPEYSEEDFRIGLISKSGGIVPTKRGLMSEGWDPVLGSVNRRKVELVLNLFSGT